MWKFRFICFPLYLSLFISTSFHLFLGLLTLFTADRTLDDLTQLRRTHDTCLGADLSLYIDAFMFGEKKWLIATVCDGGIVHYTATYLCFLYYYFWNLFAIAET